jgi:sterol desaturase/sphingolipid hydroxylase (fatty acid hydroxylase superfamily)
MQIEWQVYVRMFLVHNVRYLLFAGLAFILFYVLWKKSKKSNKIQQRLATSKDFWREITNSLLNGFVFAFMGYLLMKTPLRNATKIYMDINEHTIIWLPLSVILMLVLHDTYFYWMHRIAHHKAVFRFVHLVHHKSTNPSPFAAYSFHIFETILESGVIFIIPFTVPVHPVAFLLFSTIALAINIYGHLGYEIMPAWFRRSYLFQILSTSVYHNLHHSKFKGNYGLYFRVWDRWLGTENPDYVKEYDRIQTARFGGVTEKANSTDLLKKGVAATVLLLLFLPASAQIEGKWKVEDKTSIVEIYKQGNKYYGKLISTTPEEQKKIPAGKTVMVLTDFEKKDQVTFINGTMNMLRKKRKVKGTLILINKNTLALNGSYLGYSGKQIWTRAE